MGGWGDHGGVGSGWVGGGYSTVDCGSCAEYTLLFFFAEFSIKFNTHDHYSDVLHCTVYYCIVLF